MRLTKQWECAMVFDIDIMKNDENGMKTRFVRLIQ